MSADLYAVFAAAEPKPVTASITQANIPPSTPMRNLSRHLGRQNEATLLWKQTVDGSDVLFDAELNGIEDDFGDFETAEKPADTGPDAHAITDVAAISMRGPQRAGSLNGDFKLLDTDDRPTHKRQATNTIPSHKLNSARLGTTEVHDTPFVEEDDGWGDFEQNESPEIQDPGNLNIHPTAQPGVTAGEINSSSPDDDWEPFVDSLSAATTMPSPILRPRSSVGTATSRITTKQTTVSQRPTNIPPPSSLLQLILAVFQSLCTTNARGATTSADLASQVLLVYRTASRIVAGRTFRWKRDMILGQNMRIGQAGKAGGMKLAAVNKSETAKEQRDAEEMVQDWSKRVHGFNSIIAQAGLSPQRMRLSSSMPLKISKQPSGTHSSRQCALCGLRRTERLSDVDAHVDDLFGEFWLEHWGHKDCCDFWLLYGDMLEQR